MKKIVFGIILFIYSCDWNFKEIESYKFNIKYTIPLIYAYKDHKYFKLILDNTTQSLEKSTKSILNFSKDEIEEGLVYFKIKNGYPINVNINIDIIAYNSNRILKTINVSNIKKAQIDDDYNLVKSYDTVHSEKFNAKLFSKKKIKINAKIFWNKAGIPSNINIDPKLFFKLESKFDFTLTREN